MRNIELWTARKYPWHRSRATVAETWHCTGKRTCHPFVVRHGLSQGPACRLRAARRWPRPSPQRLGRNTVDTYLRPIRYGEMGRQKLAGRRSQVGYDFKRHPVFRTGMHHGGTVARKTPWPQSTGCTVCGGSWSSPSVCANVLRGENPSMRHRFPSATGCDPLAAFSRRSRCSAGPLSLWPAGGRKACCWWSIPKARLRWRSPTTMPSCGRSRWTICSIFLGRRTCRRPTSTPSANGSFFPCCWPCGIGV